MDEKFVSNISYTNKDFQSIYVELLDLVKKLSDKWDPSLSNESDPGVLLLKLNALIGDKNNYNIDKNVLECFPLSVTQETNARRIYDSLGYSMHWYRSATLNIGFKIIDTNIVTENTMIPKLTTMLVDSTGEHVYTLLEDVYLSTNPSRVNNIVEAKCIEGTIKDYKINGSENISINNLDEDYRLYFDSPYVAENGIFVKRAGDIQFDWERVDNLTSYSSGSKVYQFGVLPNSNTCYIQFPSDIADLMTLSPNLNIKYIVSSGKNGNIKSNIVNKFYGDVYLVPGDNTSALIQDGILIVQTNSTSNGQDPETIKEAYTNYKRVVGTFNTLVTPRDYENFVFNHESQKVPLVSNCVVSDRTCDLNVSNKVKTWDLGYTDTINIVLKEKVGEASDGTSIFTEEDDPALTAFDIVLYALNYSDTYADSFKPQSSTVATLLIEDAISDVKAISHNWTDATTFGELESALKFLMKNVVALDGQLITYSKVTADEAKEIETNILNALKQSFSARKVEFGKETTYNDFVEVIQNADARIKSVALNVPNYDIQRITLDKSGIYPSSTPSELEKVYLVARMILAGNVQLFEFDDDFDYEFGQNELSTSSYNAFKDSGSPIKSITSSTTINTYTYDGSRSAYKYKVGPNEMIQLYRPNFKTIVTYSNYTKYYYVSESKNVIPAKQDYRLKAGDTLYIYYKDSNNAEHQLTYSQGTIVNSSIEISADTDTTPSNNVFPWDNILSTGQTITIKDINKTELSYGNKYYFVTSSGELDLNSANNYKYILKENEYFAYTTSNQNEFIVLGSGTMIYTTNSVAFKKSIKKTKESEDAIANGYTDKVEWETLSASEKLNIMALEIQTIGQNVELWVFNHSEGDSAITNTPKTMEEMFPGYDKFRLYVSDSDYADFYPSITVDELGQEDSDWQVQSRLLISSNYNSPQALVSGQSFSFKYTGKSGTEETCTITGGTDPVYVQFSEYFLLSGGENTATDITTASGTSYSLKAYAYTKGTSIENLRDENTGIIILNQNSSNVKDGVAKFEFNFKGLDVAPSYPEWLIPVSINVVTSNAEIGIFTDADCTVPAQMVQGQSVTGYYGYNNKGGYIIKVAPQTTALYVKFKDTNLVDNIKIGKINKVKGYNTKEINVSDGNGAFNVAQTNNSTGNALIIEAMLDIMEHSTPTTRFDWAYRIKASDKVLFPTKPSSYWNTNHIYNKYTIPYIDFDKTSITVNPYSIS